MENRKRPRLQTNEISKKDRFLHKEQMIVWGQYDNH